MKVSIITCTLNSARYLRMCLESVRAQSYQDIEHLVVDGQSQDGTLEILKDYPNVKVLERASRGLSDAMNFGIKQASGEVVAHLHSDDYYYDSGVVERMMSELKESEKKWGYGRQLTLFPEGHSEVSRLGMFKYEHIMYRNPIVHPTVFIRKEVFEDVGCFDSRLKFSMDIDLWLRIGRKYSPVVVDTIVACFRVHSGSISVRNAGRQYIESLGIKLRYSKGNPVLVSLIIAEYAKRRFKIKERLWRLSPRIAATLESVLWKRSQTRGQKNNE